MMTIQQMFVAILCCLLATQQITAVVNNSKTSNEEETSATKNDSSSSSNVADSVASETELEAVRREAPVIAISDSYGAPLTGGGVDSYVPSGPSNPSLPIAVYGVPNAPSNNIIYPAPPPDNPPPLPFPSISPNFGTPFKTYGPPQPTDNLIENFAPPPPPINNYALPPIRPAKPFSSNGYHGPKPFRSRPQYGPPKPIFVPKPPKPNYGPPKTAYGPPKLPVKPLFVPQQNNYKQQSVTIVTIPSFNYGVPNINVGQPHNEYGPPPTPSVAHYGPPEPIPHGPPHPGVPAPPTPPDIKYDGWQPIPGLVSRPPSDSYGLPERQHHGVEDLHSNADFTPPPVGDSHNLASSSHSGDNGYSSSSHGVSDSYGAPLNSVTGSGGIVSASGDSLHDQQSLSLGLSAAGINSGQSQLSVIKSIGYELFPNSGSGHVGHIGHIGHTGGDSSSIGDSYSSPPLSSYSPDGPYAAAHSHKTHGLSHGSKIKSHIHGVHNSHNFNGNHGLHGLSLSSSGIGLIPPSGYYGAPSGGHRGTPLLSRPHTKYGPPLNALKINPPKHPVIFREPVPTGLIESIGQHTAHKDAHGIIESSHSGGYAGPAYIPPPIPDITKPVKEEPPQPSHLYSLPNPVSSVSFHNIGHGSSGALGSIGLNSNHFGGGHSYSQTLTSYTAPLGSIDGSYSLPLDSSHGYSVALDNAPSGGVTVGIDNSHPPLTIDLTSATSNVGSSIVQAPDSYNYQSLHHDCRLHKSQPLPPLSYGVPSINSYTESLSSLKTNIGGAYQGPPPPALTYGLPDLHVAHSQKINTGLVTNAIEKESQGKNYGKSLAANFGSGSELIQSENIDINNIPVQGALGTYTLQIQPAEGLVKPNPSSEPIPHGQVLNEGLIQSILSAIEQPNQNGATILGQPLLHLQPSPQNYVPQESTLENVKDAEAQNSIINEVLVSPPVKETTTSPNTATLATPEPESDTDAPLRLIDNNEIALYYSNNLQDSDETNNSYTKHNNTVEVSGVRNGQQYGSYVSFKTPHGGFIYENSSNDKYTKGERLE